MFVLAPRVTATPTPIVPMAAGASAARVIAHKLVRTTAQITVSANRLTASTLSMAMDLASP